LLGTAVALDKISKRHVLPAVWAIVGGLIVVILINELVS
jgi:hypothetical protein